MFWAAQVETTACRGRLDRRVEVNADVKGGDPVHVQVHIKDDADADADVKADVYVYVDASSLAGGLVVDVDLVVDPAWTWLLT